MLKYLIAFFIFSACACTKKPPIDPLAEAKFLGFLAKSAVLIETNDSEGSGVVVLSTTSETSKSAETKVLTCWHVIDTASEIWIKSGENKYKASIDSVDEEADLAILKTDFTGLPAIKISSTEPILYERLYSVSNPLGIEDVIADALLFAKNTKLGDIKYELWGIMGFSIFGSSGGAVVNRRGELVCIQQLVKVTSSPIFDSYYRREIPFTAKTAVPQIGYCVPLTRINSIMNK